MKKIFDIFFKEKKEKKEEIQELSFKSWKNFNSDELVKISKMLSHHAYGYIDLNFNDVFAYASAWGVECDEFDLLGLSELFEKYGPSGVIAWGAVKEGVDKPIGPSSRFPNFKEAKEEILNNKLKYFWTERYKIKKGDKI